MNNEFIRNAQEMMIIIYPCFVGALLFIALSLMTRRHVLGRKLFPFHAYPFPWVHRLEWIFWCASGTGLLLMLLVS